MSDSIPEVVDSRGRPVALGALLGKGGEGTVFEVRGADAAAKIYDREDVRRERAPKVEAMVKLWPAGLGEVVAWPLDALSLRSTGQPAGLLMPKVSNHKNVHHVYGPKSRLKDFPRADWRFLVRTGANVARAFTAVHDAGCVIGDVNHGSIMVAQDATVKLIDCDSFQIETPTKKFLCEVGMLEFAPPELQGKSFRGVVRTANYDNFGLAIIVFRLLFMGRHPFAGRFLGTDPMPIAQAIQEFRFPYGANHRAVQMEPPPGTPSLPFVGPDVAELFERAFSRAGMLSNRPTAREWAAALTGLENRCRQCSTSKSHWFPAHLTACPWCQMEAQGAKPLFPFALPSSVSSVVGIGMDVESLTQMLEALGDPGPVPRLASSSATPSQEAIAIGKPNKKLSDVVGVLAALGVFVGGMLIKPALLMLYLGASIVAFFLTRKAMSKDQQIEPLRRRLVDAESIAREAKAEWSKRASADAFNEARTVFRRCKAELQSFPQKRLDALDLLRQEQRKHQLERFLETCELEDAQIEGIGAGRKHVLESYGIEAADDVTVARLQAVPGFGPVFIERLVRWRRSCEGRFRFDPSKPLDPQDIAKVEQQMLALRNQLQAAVRTTHTQAMQAHAQMENVRQSMKKPVEELMQKAAQARADYAFVSAP